jgi:3-hydroxyisobutyrate dehydrogenase-like beta-hydroxyacid dehydrogenase
MTTLGFLGLGTMGGGMARRLVDAGHEVHVWNRSPEAADELVAAGAHRAASPHQALAADISFSMLANDAAVEAVLTADAFAGVAGRLHVGMASISPEATDRVSAVAEEAGVDYLAATVLGRPAVAAAGQLNILAAGAPELVERARPYLDVLGKRTWVLGTVPRTANVVKAAVNYNIIHAMEAIGESLALVESEGVDAEEFTTLLSQTLFAGVVYTTYGEIIANRRFHPPGFTVTLGLKDLGLAEDIASRAGVTLPAAPALRRVFEAALADDELGDGDWSAIGEIARRGETES